VTVRQVRTNGQIKWKGDRIYLSEALRGEPVGLVPPDDRFWTIWFGPLSIGLLDDHNRSVSHTPTKLLPMSLVAQHTYQRPFYGLPENGVKENCGLRSGVSSSRCSPN